MDKKLFELLVCPICKGGLFWKNNELICQFDRLAYPIKDNIPIMLETEAREVPLEELDQL